MCAGYTVADTDLNPYRHRGDAVIRTTARLISKPLNATKPPVVSPPCDGWIARLGLPPKTSARTLWVIGERREAFDSVAALLARVSDEQPRLRTVVSASTPELRSWLAKRFPAYPVYALPLGNRWLAEAYVRRSNIRAAIMLEDACLPGESLMRALQRRAICLLALAARDDAPLTAALIANACEHQLRIDAAEKGSPVAGSGNGGQAVVSLSQAAAMLGEILGRDLKERRAARGARLSPSRYAVKNCERWPFSLRLRRFHDAAALNARLHAPATILCLGNGPSSEQAEVLGERYDALFRVNHKWLERGFLCDPDVVFTGSRPAMTSLKRVIFGLQNEHQARRLAALAVLDPRRGRTGFFTVDDINPGARDFAWGTLRPTNGATMIAAAVALQPQRLVVAGIDLFQHPDGSYPGDKATPNAFSPAHARAAEIAFLLAMFERFRGELVIHGEVLAREWQRHRDRQRGG